MCTLPRLKDLLYSVQLYNAYITPSQGLTVQCTTVQCVQCVHYPVAWKVAWIDEAVELG